MGAEVGVGQRTEAGVGEVDVVAAVSGWVEFGFLVAGVRNADGCVGADVVDVGVVGQPAIDAGALCVGRGCAVVVGVGSIAGIAVTRW